MFFLKSIAFIFLLRMIWAIYNNLKLIKSLRAKRNYRGATLAITEKVIPPRIIEPSTWVVTTILDGGRALLGISIIFLLFIKSKHDGILFYPKDFLTLLVVAYLCFYAVWISGYLFGSLIAQAIQNVFSKVRHVALSEQGILYAGKIIAWDHFRGYSMSSERRYIYVLSKYYPTAIGFSFAPASNEEFSLILGEIKKHLPNCDFTSYDPGSILVNVYFQSVALSITLFFIGLTGLMMPVEIGIILNSLLMYLHILIS